jgi:uncharacterized membrane protein
MLVALASAALVAIIAYRLRLLSGSGLVPATLVGAPAVIGGAQWVAADVFHQLERSVCGAANVTSLLDR